MLKISVVENFGFFFGKIFERPEKASKGEDSGGGTVLG